MLSHAVGDIAYHGGPTLFAGYFAGAAGVDMFFVISGFIMIHSAAALFGRAGASWDFLARRVIRLAPLYWAATAAYAAVQMAQGKWDLFGVRRMLTSILFIPSLDQNGSPLPFYSIGWTLNYEMFFYAVFAMGMLFPRRIGLGLVAAGLGGMVAAGAVVALPQPLAFWSRPVLVDFLFGMGLGLAFLGGRRLPPAAAAALALSGAALLVVFTRQGFNFDPTRPGDVPRWLVWGLPCAAIFAGVVFGAGGAARELPLLGLLGDASYATYLVHPLIIIGLRPALPWLELHGGLSPVAAAGLQVGLVSASVVAASIAVHLAFERPLTRRLGRAWSRRSTAPV